MPVTVPAPARARLREPGRPAPRRRRARRRRAAAHLHRGPAVHRLPPAGRRDHEDRRQARYHGDFDWPGISHRRRDHHQAQRAPPWRLTAADYETAIKNNADYVSLAGTPQPTPWDPSLAAAMTAHGRAVYEESVADPLIADLAGNARTPSG